MLRFFSLYLFLYSFFVAAEGLVDGAMFNAGQSCCGIERVYVHESNYEKFLEKAAEIISGYVSPPSLPP